MSEHELKCWPEFFSAILTGEKTFELRKDDRQPPFRAGDVLWLREWRRLTVKPTTGEYTGRDLRVTVTYVLSGFGLEKDYVVMGFRLPAPAMDYGELVRKLNKACEPVEGSLSTLPSIQVNGVIVQGSVTVGVRVLRAAADAIEALVREKDAASHFAAQSTPLAKKLLDAEARADQLAAENERLAAEHTKVHEWNNTLVSHLMQARAALRLVEWDALPGFRCYWCKARQEGGHHADCPRQVALGEPGQP